MGIVTRATRWIMSTPGTLGTRIVLVMDGPDPVLESLERELEELEYERQRATSLQEFQRLAEESEPPDVVITGVSLPDGNWCDVLRSVVRSGESTCVLVCTQEADERLWSEAIWRGVHDVLVEPFVADDLRKRFESCDRLTRKPRPDEPAAQPDSDAKRRSSGSGLAKGVARLAAA